MTAYGNDDGYHTIFKQQLQTLARAGDLVIAISGSGKVTFNLDGVTQIRGSTGDDTFNVSAPSTRNANGGQGLLLRGGLGTDTYNINGDDLSGVAGNAVAADRAMLVAKSMVPEGGAIVNAMQVAPAQQVMLKVRFLEVGRSASRELGVNWFGANNAGNRGFITGVGSAAPGGRPSRRSCTCSSRVAAGGSSRGSRASTGCPVRACDEI